MSDPVTVPLRRCVTHETTIGCVAICREHEADLKSAIHGGSVPSWHYTLGMSVYKGVFRGLTGPRVCDACKHEALAPHGLTAANVIEQPAGEGMVELYVS